MSRIEKTPQDLANLLSQSSGNLAGFGAKAKTLQSLNTIIAEICPDIPEEIWQVANCRQETVVLEVKSAVWGQRLQFERNRICQHLAQQSQGQLTRLELKINPYGHQRQTETPAPKKPSEQPGKHMSMHTAEQLNMVAEHAPQGLKEKLQKLARHASASEKKT
ncbi:DUF721 domain-containing protein [Thalassotalea mangrovi]|uniref:DUF721 domain-containing protein n=1 Tax=Thalassotalea mangrovi TaxID=2572245 RepID=A0A4U1BA43_9GAMM|nr:DciA family protein [Thalassotalea mangrovi]TKB47682.1 DUF721 domain-containing protein [Thalassotalea mangrovi]